MPPPVEEVDEHADGHPRQEPDPRERGQVQHQPQAGEDRQDRHQRHERHAEPAVQVRPRLAQHWRSKALILRFEASSRFDFDFGAGVPDTSAFPFEWWRRLSARALRAFSRAPGGYAEPEGRLALREAIARLNPHIPPGARDDALRRVLSPNIPGLVNANRQLHRWLVDGVPVEFQKGGETTLLDFASSTFRWACQWAAVSIWMSLLSSPSIVIEVRIWP